MRFCSSLLIAICTCFLQSIAITGETAYVTVIVYDAIVKEKNIAAPSKIRMIIAERRRTPNIHETPITFTARYKVPFDEIYKNVMDLGVLSKLFISSQAMDFISGSKLNLSPEIDGNEFIDNKLFWLEDSKIENVPIVDLMQETLSNRDSWVDQLLLKSLRADDNVYLQHHQDMSCSQLLMDYGLSPDSELILFESVDPIEVLKNVNFSVDIFLEKMKKKYIRRPQIDGSIKYESTQDSRPVSLPENER